MRFSEETLRHERDKKLRSKRSVHEETGPYFVERWGGGGSGDGGDSNDDDDDDEEEEEEEEEEDRGEERDKEGEGWRGYSKPYNDTGGFGGIQVRAMTGHVSGRRGRRLSRVRSFTSW